MQKDFKGSYHITLAGVISDPDYHACAKCIEELKKQYGAKIQSMELQFFKTQWEQYLKRLQNEMKGEFYHHSGSPVVFVNGRIYIGGKASFLEWAL